MKAIFLILIIIISVGFGFSQEKEASMISEADESSCERNSFYFEDVARLARSKGERVFAIFRAGKSETETVNAR